MGRPARSRPPAPRLAGSMAPTAIAAAAMPAACSQAATRRCHWGWLCSASPSCACTLWQPALAVTSARCSTKEGAALKPTPSGSAQGNARESRVWSSRCIKPSASACMPRPLPVASQRDVAHGDAAPAETASPVRLGRCKPLAGSCQSLPTAAFRPAWPPRRHIAERHLLICAYMHSPGRGPAELAARGWRVQVWLHSAGGCIQPRRRRRAWRLVATWRQLFWHAGAHPPVVAARLCGPAAEPCALKQACCCCGCCAASCGGCRLPVGSGHQQKPAEAGPAPAGHALPCHSLLTGGPLPSWLLSGWAL